ncbi:MAG: AraC family transcriptional regulator [Acidimicrobiales bacterium]
MSEAPLLDESHTIPVVADPLAEALHFLRMDGMFYCLSEMTSPWGLDLPTMPDSLWFHVVTAGACTLIDAAGDEHHIQTGDVVVLPHGGGHRALDVPGTDTPLVFDLPHDYVSRQYAVLRHGGGGAPTTIICGVLQLGHPAARTLISLLPELIRIDGRTAAAEWPWLSTLLGLMASETRAAKPGGEAVVTRLCDILVIQAIRHWIETAPEAREGWLGALRDPAIGRAIGLIHRFPEREWSVATLAAEVAMSRSAFSARFTELVGTSAMQYATEWRMNVAVDLLRDDGLPIAVVAERLGYGSEAAFSRAFKRVTGKPPSTLR